MHWLRTAWREASGRDRIVIAVALLIAVGFFAG